MIKDKIEITLSIKTNEKKIEREITEDQTWLIIQASKSLVEARNTIIEILGNKAEDFINNIVNIDREK